MVIKVNPVLHIQTRKINTRLHQIVEITKLMETTKGIMVNLNIKKYRNPLLQVTSNPYLILFQYTYVCRKTHHHR